MNRRWAYLLLVSLSVSGILAGDNSPGLLGSPSSPAASIPDSFGPDENVRWSVDTPKGSSSPIVWKKRIYLTGVDDGALWVLAYDRNDGSLIWKTSFTPTGEESLMHRDADPAQPTPVTDGERILAYFGAYGLVVLDMNGETLWEKKFAIEDNTFGTGTSPVLDRKTVYLVRDVSGASAAAATSARPTSSGAGTRACRMSPHRCCTTAVCTTCRRAAS